MTIEEFMRFCSYVATKSSGDEVIKEKSYFTAIAIAKKHPSFSPPKDDDAAVNGYKFGRKIAKHLSDDSGNNKT